MTVLTNLLIIAFLEIIAITTRAREFFMLTGLIIIIFGFSYWTTNEWISIALVVAGVLNARLK